MITATELFKKLPDNIIELTKSEHGYIIASDKNNRLFVVGYWDIAEFRGKNWKDCLAIRGEKPKPEKKHRPWININFTRGSGKKW